MMAISYERSIIKLSYYITNQIFVCKKQTGTNNKKTKNNLPMDDKMVQTIHLAARRKYSLRFQQMPSKRMTFRLHKKQ